MNRSAMGRPVVPKEHGAWAVLYGAFLAGVGVAGQVTLPVLLLLVGVTAAAFANGPLTLLARPTAGAPGPASRRRALGWLLVYGSVGAAATAPLLLIFRMTFLLPFAMGAAFFLLLRAYLIHGREERSLLGELVGAAGLTLVGPAAHAVAAQRVLPTGAVLWLLLFLFFASGVFYVRMRVRGQLARRPGAGGGSHPAVWSCVLYHLLLLGIIPALAATRLIPWAVLLAFAPALWRAAAGLRRQEAPLNLRRLGWSETVLATTFVVLLVGAYWLQSALG